MKLVWNYWSGLAEAETKNLEMRGRSNVKSEEKINVFEMEGIGIETLLKIGAVLGNGSEIEIEHLGNYGRILGTILEIIKDFKVSVNLTLELSEKIGKDALPYTLLWAKDRSQQIRELLPLLRDKASPVDVKKIVEAILETKTLEHILELIDNLSQKAEGELLELERDKTNILKYFLRAQSKIFMESLSAMH
jgi:geranylgeranyl pyrophosphate synthase